MDQLIKDIKKKQSQIYDVRDYVERATYLYKRLSTHYSSQNAGEMKEVCERLGEYLNTAEKGLNNILYKNQE